jgi:hypothetical protein
MYVDIAIHLFSRPDVELQEYRATGSGLRAYAADLGQRLGAVADLVDKLRKDGWSVLVRASNIEAWNLEVTTRAEAVARLKRLQIEEGAITDIAEWSVQGKRLNPGRR